VVDIVSLRNFKLLPTIFENVEIILKNSVKLAVIYAKILFKNAGIQNFKNFP
jgi:hypothetical protein